jgi:prolyl 4-hydroxylase
MTVFGQVCDKNVKAFYMLAERKLSGKTRHVTQMAKQYPGAQRVPDRRIELFIKRGFADAAECAALVRLIDRAPQPSTITDDIGDPAFRTSETCAFDAAHPVVAKLDARLDDYLGIDARFGEPMQGQRYAVGQEFKLHTDYFEPDGPTFDLHCRVAGQRTWTAMLYLNDPAAGGATRFKTIGKTIDPELGKLVFWNNRLPDGRPNPATLHQGMKVRAGWKHIITKWYRERPVAP